MFFSLAFLFFMVVVFDNDKYHLMRNITRVLVVGYVAMVLGLMIGGAIHGV